MRIVFLTTIPSPYQRELFARLAGDASLEIAAFYYAAGAPDREWATPRFEPFEKVLSGRILKRLGPMAHWNPAVLDEIDVARADLVVVSDYTVPSAQIAMRTMARHGHCFAFWGEIPGFSKRGPIGNRIRRTLQSPLGRSDAIVAIGSGAVAAYQQLFPRTPVLNIPYFCDLATFRETSRQATRDNGRAINILFSGQLIERKGVDVLLKAFATAAGTEPRLRLHLIGSGPERARFEALVPPELGDRVVFMGHQDPGTLPAIFATADAFCLPSRHDGWGVVVNEALGAGLPILVSDAVGAGRDLVTDNVNGFVTPAGDVAALASALTRISDDAVRLRMAAASRKAALDWDLDEGARRWREAAARIIEARKRGNGASPT